MKPHVLKTRMLPLEAADFLGCKYDKLLQMVRRGELPHYRIGRRVFFTREGLIEWIEQQEKESVQQD